MGECEWQPIDTVPRDGRAVLVWMPKPHLRSHYAVATYFEKNTAIVGGCFAFDLEAKPTVWRAIAEYDPPQDHSEKDSVQP